MRRQSDEKVAVEIVVESKKRFPELAVVSWDKGAHSPQNQRELKATKGFERYVALAVLVKNIHCLGTVLREQQKERLFSRILHLLLVKLYFSVRH